MKTLHPEWLTQGRLDFEYKKYILLAYLQETTGLFNEKKLYPFLSDLIFHYNNLLSVKENKKVITNAFPKNIRKIDLENFRIEYERIINDDEYLEIINEIIDFAIPRIKSEINTGKEIYEYVEDNIDIYPVGVIPLHTESGYVLIRQLPIPETRVYNYKITLFENQDDRYRGIRLSYLTTYWRTYSITFESIKTDLLKTNKNQPIPAIFGIMSKELIPFEETLLPIAKRAIVRYIASMKK